MMIGHCIFIIKHFCAAVNFDYRLGGKLKIYFQPPPPRDNANYYCIATNCTKGSDLSPLHSLHTLCVCYAGRANADVVFLNCPTSFAAVREFSIDIFVCQLQIVTLRVYEKRLVFLMCGGDCKFLTRLWSQFSIYVGRLAEIHAHAKRSAQKKIN